MSITRKAVTSLTLDLSMPDVQTGFTCTLGDRARRLEILVTDGGRPYDIPPTWSAFLSGVKPDQTELVNGCVVEGGRLIYDFESGDQIATCAGRFAVTVWIYDEEGVPVASPKIWVNVIDSGVQTIMNNNSSEDQFGVLQEIVGTLNALIEKDAQVDSDIGNLIRREEIVIPSSTWKDETPLEYSNSVMVPMSGAKTILLYPANDESKAEATRVRLSAEVKTGTLYGYDATYTVFRSSGTEAPEIDIKLVAISVTPKEENAIGSSRVIMVGFNTTADDIDESIKEAKNEIASAKKDISAAKISIEMAKNDIDQAKQDIEDTVTVSSVTVAKDSFLSNFSILEAPAVDEGDVLIVMPGDVTTRNEMSLHRITVNVEPSIEKDRVIMRKEDDGALENDLNLTVIRLKDSAQSDPKVVLIGVNTTADDIDESIKKTAEEIGRLKEKDAQVDEELETLRSKLKNVVSSKVITIDPSQWTDVSPHEAAISIGVPGGTERRSTVLLIPKNKETRDESQAIELTVKMHWTMDQAMTIIIYMTRQDTDPPTIPLSYLALVVYDEDAHEEFTATAEFVGVVNLPDELMEREVKRALEALGVDEEIAALSSRLGNVVSSRVITIDPSQWTDSAPLDASINIYVPGGTERRSTVLLIPKNKATRDESQRIELAVTTHWTTDQVMSIMILMKRQDTDPPTIPLSYLALVVYDEEAADDSTSTAEFVGVVNLPDELMEREVKRALEVLGVTYDTPTSIDLSRMDEGEIVETFAGGSTKTTTIEYDADGNPVKITDGDGNETVLTW